MITLAVSLAPLLLPPGPGWHPERNVIRMPRVALTCHTLDSWYFKRRAWCDDMRTMASFRDFMAGPGGELNVLIVSRGGTHDYIPIAPSDIWPLWRMDGDEDGDIDLRDWAMWSAER